MAITAADVALWKELRAMGILPPSPAVVEIGQANWYGDVPIAPGYDLACEADRFAAARAFWYEALAPDLLTAIDLHGQEGQSLPFDLNQPIELGDMAGFDVLINTGTLEHVFNQHQAWKNCHDLVKPGGLMVHNLPWTGWLNHGLYSYQPGFVLDLADANGYETLILWCSTIQPLNVRPVFAHEGASTLTLRPGEDTMLQVVYRKGPTHQPFATPMQSCYAARPPGWQQVPGWLSPCEGEALQKLAKDRFVLELGAYKGRSTCCLAEVARWVASVDHHKGDSGTGAASTHGEWRANVNDQGHTGKVLGVCESFAVASLTLPRGYYNLVFVDGDHSADGTEEACRLALRCVTADGTIAVHDWELESVREGAARCGLLAPDGHVGSLAWFEEVSK